MIFLSRYKHAESKVIILTNQQYKKAKQNKTLALPSGLQLYLLKGNIIIWKCLPESPPSLTPLQKEARALIISFALNKFSKSALFFHT